MSGGPRPEPPPDPGAAGGRTMAPMRPGARQPEPSPDPGAAGDGRTMASKRPGARQPEPPPDPGAAGGASATIDVRLRAGAFTLDLRETIAARTVALFGPSGSGKTTTLDAVAGLRRPDEGLIRIGRRVLFDSRRGIDVPVHDRRVGYVPQDLALFPHLDVRRNVFYGARGPAASGRAGTGSRTRDADRARDTGRASVAGPRGPEPRRAPASVLELLEIDTLLPRAVDGLSGGERQRVALARALMTDPDLLLLDEPLAALDLGLRDRILPYLERVRDELGTPMIYVSHAADEVRRVADWVIVLDAGRALRSGIPADVLEGPDGR